MVGAVVRLNVKDGTFDAYLATPTAPKGPALVVLQEIFGVNANIRSIVDDFAAQGYIAIAPDLFWRQAPGVQLDPSRAEDRERAMALLNGLDQTRAAEDGFAALQHALSLPGASGKGGAVGYCLGGKIAYLLASRFQIAAAVSYYGVAIQTALDEAPIIQGDILLHLAGADHLCPPEAQTKIIYAMRALGARAVVETYDGVGHAFARRGGQTFDQEASARSNAVTAAFLTRTLGG